MEQTIGSWQSAAAKRIELKAASISTVLSSAVVVMCSAEGWKSRVTSTAQVHSSEGSSSSHCSTSRVPDTLKTPTSRACAGMTLQKITIYAALQRAVLLWPCCSGILPEPMDCVHEPWFAGIQRKADLEARMLQPGALSMSPVVYASVLHSQAVRSLYLLFNLNTFLNRCVGRLVSRA